MKMNIEDLEKRFKEAMNEVSGSFIILHNKTIAYDNIIKNQSEIIKNLRKENDELKNNIIKYKLTNRKR
jgi:hypothetical protein